MSRAALSAALAVDPAQAGLVLDFDGVLAAIGDDPAASALTAGTAAVLETLARRLGMVAVLSGRPLAFLRERAAVPGVALHGSYGAQWSEGERDLVLAEVGSWRPAVRAATAALHAAYDHVEGVVVEDKDIAVAVHWRRAPEQGPGVQRRVAELVRKGGLRAEPGKFVLELRPPLRQDKGITLRRLAAGLAVVVYVGDDRGDLPAMKAARELGGYAVAVAHGSETIPELLDTADVVLEGTDEVAAWLTELTDVLAGKGQ